MERLVKTTQSALDKLVKAGADFGYAFTCDTEKQEFNVEGNQFSLFRTTFNNSLELCAYKDKKKGSISINNLDEAAIDEAVANCISFAKEGNADDAYAIFEKQEDKHFDVGVKEADIDKFYERCNELLESIKTKYPKLLITLMVASFDKSKCCYQNTNGTKYTEERGIYHVVLEYSAKDGDEVTSLNYFELPFVSLDQAFVEHPIVKEKLEECENLLGAKALEGKLEDPTVIFTPGCLTNMLGFLYESFIGESTIIDKTCFWYDKLNEKVCDERFTLSIKPEDSRIIDGSKFSFSGKEYKDYDVIKDGVLKAFPISLYASNKSGFKPAPCLSYIPVIEGGNKSLDEIIKETTNGIIVGGYSGGEPSASGEFSGVAKNSFLVKDGKISGPVNEAMISGNFVSMLNSIVDISKETLCDGNVVMPYLACKGIVVAGK